jgi:peptide/nickel transport system ATP-binding protein
MGPKGGEPLLQVRDLRTYFYTRSGVVRAVDGIDLDVAAGEIVGLVGESGSGKSNVCLSILNLVPKPAGRIVSGEVLLQGRDLLRLSDRQMRGVRGRDIAMILQDPSSALNPVLTIGAQVAEALDAHEPKARGHMREFVIDALRKVQIPSPAERLGDYPHQFSGGMRQRAMTAIAVSCRPKLLLADEPTTALDVTTQAQFLDLMQSLRDDGLGIIYVTHDLGVVAELCDRVAVMYAGRIVETGTAEQVFARPHHPYTAGLINSVPVLGNPHKRLFQIDGLPPNPLQLPAGCPFSPRCAFATDTCRTDEPGVTPTTDGRTFRCWHPIADDSLQTTGQARAGDG